VSCEQRSVNKHNIQRKAKLQHRADDTYPQTGCTIEELHMEATDQEVMLEGREDLMSTSATSSTNGGDTNGCGKKLVSFPLRLKLLTISVVLDPSLFPFKYFYYLITEYSDVHNLKIFQFQYFMRSFKQN